MTTQYILELTGTFFFAISGALAVADVENDLFGAGFGKHEKMIPWNCHC